MFQVRKAAERGHGQHGWLDTWHSFSFADYHDPAHNRFRMLRVMNEDRIQPGQGFGMHGHRDMEIVTYVLEGSLEHRDSLGNGAVLRPGELQRMTAGTGVLHSEFNPSPDQPTHLYQIWIFPREKNLKPGYEQKAFQEEGARNRWQLLASPEGRQGSLTIQQDVAIWRTLLNEGEALPYSLAAGRFAWVQILRGQVECNGLSLQAGDGLAVSDEPALTLKGQGEILLFDLN